MSQNNPFIHKLPVVVSVFRPMFNPNVVQNDAHTSNERIIQPSVLLQLYEKKSDLNPVNIVSQNKYTCRDF